VKKIKAQNYDKTLVIIDRNVIKYQQEEIAYFSQLCKIEDMIVVDPVSKYKDLARCESIITGIAEKQLTRKSCLIGIGGGYVGDLAGFIASIYMRGIDFVQIPTTLMAMGDVIIGKVAVNFGGYKNLLGNFHSPRFVFCETNFLKGLPPREITYGLVEVWKHAILVGDNVYVQKIEGVLAKKDCSDFPEIVAFSLTVKKQFVEQDYYDERGHHKAISLGHTFGNYFENQFQMRHGEAIFYGIVLATILSRELGKVTTKRERELLFTASLFEKNIRRIKFVQKNLRISDLLRKIKFDKINNHGSYSFVLPTGKGYIVERGVSPSILRKAAKRFKVLKL
jgi:3-dehydroquinate synthase